MAYFADQKAKRTGTDKSTRSSIAKGVTSPYFKNTSGKNVLRGVVQYDLISGNDTGYATGTDLQSRINSASSYYNRKRAIRAQQRETSINQPQNSVLHSSTAGTITTSDTHAFSFKTIGLIFGIGLIGYLVLNK